MISFFSAEDPTRGKTAIIRLIIPFGRTQFKSVFIMNKVYFYLSGRTKDTAFPMIFLDS